VQHVTTNKLQSVIAGSLMNCPLPHPCHVRTMPRAKSRFSFGGHVWTMWIHLYFWAYLALRLLQLNPDAHGQLDLRTAPKNAWTTDPSSEVENASSFSRNKKRATLYGWENSHSTAELTLPPVACNALMFLLASKNPMSCNCWSCVWKRTSGGS
jgi:hypothetical protein